MSSTTNTTETPFDSRRFINRELSWLEFNHRVLEEAMDATNPLLERVKFFCIVSSNLDEFFEVRVAGIKQQMESEVVERSVDGLTATETFVAITKRVRTMLKHQYQCWRKELLPDLERHGVQFPRVEDLKEADRKWIGDFYYNEVRPVLTPLGIDPAHPFPQLLNKSLNMMVELETYHQGKARKRLAIVQVPRVLPRLIRVPASSSARNYVFLGNLIGSYLEDLFPGNKILGYWRFRVTRNSELYIDEEDIANLLKAVEMELHNRRRGDAVRLEVDASCPESIRKELLQKTELTGEDLYVLDGPLSPHRLMEICEGDHSPELRYPPFLAAPPANAPGDRNLFERMRERDILLHHPFESFETVVDFVESAAHDPQVLAIKQTLYRTGGDTRIVGALMNAVENGKQVTAVVELKARFDEANNIEWSRRLEEAGVHVVYGLVGYKIHGKMCLVVRRDEDKIRRYLHLGTGNYNASTARLYTDIGLLTCDPDLGEDATNLFNLLTGICQFRGMRKLMVAPFDLHQRTLRMILRETENARKGLPARIIAKMNSLVEKEIIEALYRASQAGVRIDLIVRGTCCLRPQIKGVSENIRVRSVVERFLEHSRIFYFENACRPEVYLGSADWMPRNFFRRIEVVFPVENGVLRDRIISEILDLYLQDNVKARELKSNGLYARIQSKKPARKRRAQTEFMELGGKRRSIKGAAIKGGQTYPRVQVRKKPGESAAC